MSEGKSLKIIVPIVPDSRGRSMLSGMRRKLHIEHLKLVCHSLTHSLTGGDVNNAASSLSLSPHSRETNEIAREGAGPAHTPTHGNTATLSLSPSLPSPLLSSPLLSLPRVKRPPPPPCPTPPGSGACQPYAPSRCAGWVSDLIARFRDLIYLCSLFYCGKAITLRRANRANFGQVTDAPCSYRA